MENINEINEINLNNSNIEICRNADACFMYGAGFFGKQCLKILKDSFLFTPAYFIDDDPNKCGTELEGIRIISYHEMVKIKGKKCIIVSSIYEKAICRKIKKNENILIFVMSDLYMGMLDFENLIRKQYFENESELHNKLEQVNKILVDDESKVVLQGIEEYIKTGNRKIVKKIATSEEHYFIPEIIDACKMKLGGVFRLLMEEHTMVN